MEQKVVFYKAAVVSFIAFVLEQFGALGILWLILIVLFVFDFITGTIASTIEKQNKIPDSGLESKKGALGILKKVSYAAACGLGLCLDLFVYATTDFFNIHLPINTFFGTVVCAWFVLNEMLSILENIERSGADYPEWLSGVIKVLKNRVDDAVEDEIKPVTK